MIETRDIIRVVERKDGKRHYHEYNAKYTFYYEDQRGKYKSVYGDPLTRIVCKNTKDFRKEVAINKGKNLFESDINPIFQCFSENYLNQDAPKLNIAFFDIETDFDPERGFADPADPFHAYYKYKCILAVDGNNDMFSSASQNTYYGAS